MANPFLFEIILDVVTIEAEGVEILNYPNSIFLGPKANNMIII
jgi:hypothetical protein